MAESRQADLVGFGIANYRCFDETGFIIDDLQKITVLIGKNNCGKSNVLRAMRLLKRITSTRMSQGTSGGSGLGLTPEIDSYKRSGAPPTAIVLLASEPLNVVQNRALHQRLHEGGSFVVRWNTATGESDIRRNFEEWTDSNPLMLRDGLMESRYRDTPSRNQILTDLAGVLITRALQALRTFDRVMCVENFREIRRADPDTSGGEVFNGHNVIEKLRVMQVPRIGQEDKRQIFERIQRFVRDLLGEPELMMEVPIEEDAIYVSMHQKRLPLESYGTGVHQLVILCAALAMHEDHIVCIEEPEIHLHPQLQRKFIQFIAEQTKNRYFITTHSSVFLDSREDVRIYHVSNDGTKSTIVRVDATPAARTVLADLGYKASDLLQANCVIWVEGPSDRVYLNGWLKLMAPDLIEGIHYAITFYGGRVLAHFTGRDDPEEDLVEVLRINQHAMFVMDRDDVQPDGILSGTKARIQEEIERIDNGWCWVTQGREIENYLRPELINKYVSRRLGQSMSVSFSEESRLEEAIEEATKGVQGRRIDYAKEKVAYAREFRDLFEAEDLDCLDLRRRVAEVVARIRSWNQMGPAVASEMPND